MSIARFCAATGQGRRDNQEDRFLCRPDLGTFAVADGIGGHRDGEVAAELACSSIESIAVLAQKAVSESGMIPRTCNSILRAGMTMANSVVLALGDPDQEERTPGTTMTAIRFAGFPGDDANDRNLVTFGHAGDSRLYHFRKAPPLATPTAFDQAHGFDMKQVTTDQGYWGGLLNRIGRPIDRFAEDVAYGTVEVQRGDILLLATDGLWCHVDPREDLRREIAYCIDKEGFPGVAQWLVDVCMRSGGKDNTTVIAIEVGEVNS